jgi:hypothetical protein
MPADDDVREGAPFELAATMAGLVLAALAAAALFPGADPIARVLWMAVAAGLLAAWVGDGRVAVAVAVAAALLFVGFLTHRYGDLLGDLTPWSYAPVIGSAVLLGRAGRRVRHAFTVRDTAGVARDRAAGRNQDEGDARNRPPLVTATRTA